MKCKWNEQSLCTDWKQSYHFWRRDSNAARKKSAKTEWYNKFFFALSCVTFYALAQIQFVKFLNIDHKFCVLVLFSSSDSFRLPFYDSAFVCKSKSREKEIWQKWFKSFNGLQLYFGNLYMNFFFFLSFRFDVCRVPVVRCAITVAFCFGWRFSHVGE